MIFLQPWRNHLTILLLVLLLAAAVLLTGALGVAVWRHGVLSLFRGDVPSVLRRPLFDVLHDLIHAMRRRIMSCVRFGMLLCLTLDEEEQKALRRGLGPELQEALFRRPLVDLLPGPVRRLLFGPEEGQQGLVQQLTPRKISSVARPNTDTEPCRAGPRVPAKAVTFREEAPDESDAVLETVLAGWTVGAAFSYARLAGVGTCRQLHNSLQRRWHNVLQSWRMDTAPALREACPRLWDQLVDVSPSLLGGAMISVGCGSVGLVGGGLIGAICGLVPAVLTFGLSIPVGAVIGGLVGWCGGLTSGILFTVLASRIWCFGHRSKLEALEARSEALKQL
mmetsp:Transcript_45389/g.106037  ORF Transcript_45389/g.106037 Transcript_45389/m.106037 type:complete len:336 (-) Transcript_45389:438-1445(-)